MGKITAIKVQKNNKKRFNVYIDDSFAFGVHEDVLISHNLTAGKELSIDYIEEVILAEEQSKANNYALKLLGYRARSEHEIRSRLDQKGYESIIIEETVRFLKKNNYIDDYAFAKALVNDELNLKKSGEGLIKQKLLQKGISKEIIQSVLKELLDEEESLAACIKLAEKKLNTSYRDDAPMDKMRKVAAFLQRRGYPYSMIKKAVRGILSED
ncbi:MAG: recombinase RecX [Clostridiales bacterium]|jgi:regulatory protein|nr:recombinase RecX [Clostridiales bacterium]HHX25025.1 recombinase RecX [Thermoanaerobacterales bacterium]